MELQKNPQHIVWLDVVRFVAMFTVVCCHCTCLLYTSDAADE